MSSIWSLVACGLNDGEGTTFVGVLDSTGKVWRHPALAAYADMASALNDWDHLEPVLRELNPADGSPANEARLLAPLPAPGKLICAGANYRSHLQEMLGSGEVPAGFEPFFFILPATSIIGSGETITIPEDESARVDWEAELGVVIGREAKDVSVDEALSVVAGYTIVNDISSRGYHRVADPLAPPFAFDWLRSKGRDTFTPIGPSVTPSWFIPDPQSLPVQLRRNGVLEQDGNTLDMIFGVAQLIASASSIMTLKPGDVLATGTPAGVGAGQGKGEFLRVGDTLEVSIAPLGTLCNEVQGENLQADVKAAALGGAARA
jgi:2,4-diketo-3-deoxy-L-fuconate hydrolase